MICDLCCMAIEPNEFFITEIQSNGDEPNITSKYHEECYEYLASKKESGNKQQ